MKTEKCPTCGNKPSHLDLLNHRVRMFVDRTVIDGIHTPKDLPDRLSDDAVFGFGFADFLPSTHNDSIAGSFRAAIYVGELPKRFGPDVRPGDWRYFICFLPSPCSLIAGQEVDYAMAEYWKGGAYRISNTLPTGYAEIAAMLDLPDLFFAAWVRGVWWKFYNFVMEETRELW